MLETLEPNVKIRKESLASLERLAVLKGSEATFKPL
jgi:hypothetical protein